MAPPVSVSELVDLLSTSPDNHEIMRQLKTLVQSVSKNALKEEVKNICFENIFACLRSEENEHVSVCCVVLATLLEGLDPLNFIEQFHDELLIGLGHPHPDVKKLVIDQVLRLSDVEPLLLCKHDDVMINVTSLLADDNLNVSQRAARVLAKLTIIPQDLESRATLKETHQQPVVPEGLPLIFNSKITHQLQQCLEHDETTRFRVYDVVVGACVYSPAALQVAAHAGFLSKLVNEIYKDDILLQLSALEALQQLASSPHGLQHLEQCGAVRRLTLMLTAAENDPLAGLLLPGLIKFFGKVIASEPARCADGDFEHFLPTLLRILEAGDPSLQKIVVDTVGAVAGTGEGKLALGRCDGMHAACRILGNMTSQGTSEVKITAMEALASMLACKQDVAAEVLTLTEHWYMYCLPRPTEIWLKLARQPFVDVRYAVFALFQALATAPWGQKSLNAEPKFKEYLLDRNTEKAKEGKEAKFAIIKTLAESKSIRETFGAPYQLKLRMYCREGALYVRVEAAVAMEEG